MDQKPKVRSGMLPNAPKMIAAAEKFTALQQRVQQQAEQSATKPVQQKFDRQEFEAYVRKVAADAASAALAMDLARPGTSGAGCVSKFLRNMKTVADWKS